MRRSQQRPAPKANQRPGPKTKKMDPRPPKPEVRAPEKSSSGILSGVHPVLEALRAGRTMNRLYLARGVGGPRIQEAIDLCREKSIPVRFEERAALDRLARGATHQGVVAQTAQIGYRSLEQILPGANLVVVLDGVEDPQNLGAIVRTAHAAGAAGVVIPERRAVGITPVVAKAAAGALEHLPVVRVTNLNRALETLKEAGFWIYGLDGGAKDSYDTLTYNTPTVLVAGGEGHGLHQHTREHCDALIRIPMHGAISSLNVSVATGIALFELRRRFGHKAGNSSHAAPTASPPSS